MILRAMAALFVLALSPAACARDMPQAPEATPAPAITAQPARVLAIRASGELAEALRRGSFFRWMVPEMKGVTVTVGPDATGDAELTLSLLPAAPDLAARVRGLPVELGGDAIVLGGARYASGGEALAFRLPDAGKPAWVVVGRGKEDAVSLADEVLFRLAFSLAPDGRRGRRRGPLDADYLVRETPYMQREGKWLKAAGGWTIDRAADRDELADWSRTFAALSPLRGERVTLLVPQAERERPELVRLAADLDRAAAEMQARLPARQDRPLTVVVESDHVAQARHAGDVGEAVPGRRADLHLVWDARDLGAYRYALARALISRAGLTAQSPPWIARGAALWLSGDWYGKPYRDWLPLFAAARVLPTAGDLLAGDDGPNVSAPLWTPAAAAIVDRLPGATLAEKLARTPSQSQLATLLKDLSAIQNPKSKIQNPSPPPLPFLAGVSLSMLNSLEGGYHAPALDGQLAALQALGANAVSLMPFASQPGPDRPELSYLNRGPGSETDIGLIHATRRARERGMHVLYKPHLWISHGSWPGDVEMKSEEDWARWWRGYRLYILHHAFLARWAGADLFSVGCELSKTVKREAEWRDLIAAVRVLYPHPGIVTYSGNWYGDLEGVNFWDALDAIGLDTYYPLAATPQATRADLDRGARAIADRFGEASRRWDRKVLLTEVGFAAHKGAWVAPHTEGGEYSEEDQALAYQALFAALGRRPWLAGTFVWKAFSAPGVGDGDADFRFQGRKAEKVIRDYYTPRP
jgi:hypothetical protein